MVCFSRRRPITRCVLVTGVQTCALPIEFKICVIASPADRAALRWHDCALRIVRNEAGEEGFECYAGGGMGRTPFIAYKIRDFLPTTQILSYLQAVLRVWNRNARRDNIHKQRMKILVHELGEEEFRRQVEEEFQRFRSEERRVGKGWCHTCRYWWLP